jgi:hypothetical protein
MPRIKLTTNIGTRDAARLSLPGVLDGEVIEVDSAAAAELLARGLGVEVPPDTLRAVPPVEIRSEPEPLPVDEDEPDGVEDDATGGDAAPTLDLDPAPTPPKRRRGRPRKDTTDE